jgi:hypothetical protein
MKKLHFTAATLPVVRRASALPPVRYRIFVDCKVDHLPMVSAIADPVRSGCYARAKPTQWRVPNIVTDPTDEPAVMTELI